MAITQPLVQTSPHHVTYLNSIFSSFISGLGDYVRSDLFPRAKDTIISTHTKAVEMVRTRKNLANENWSPKFPFLVVQPNMDIKPEPLLGRLYHSYPNYYSRFASKLYAPRMYEDDDVYIAPVLNRYVGSMDCIAWCSSIYEAIDLRLGVFQMFGGEGVYIQPRNLDCLLIIPEFLENYTYENKYTEETKVLDWSSSQSSQVLIRNINKNQLCAPITLRPIIKLLSIDDSYDSYGGSGDTITDHRVSIQIEWECNIPTHLVMIEKKMPRPSIPISFETSYKYKFVRDPLTDELLKLPDEMFNTSVVDLDSTSVEKKFLEYNKLENYIITEADIVKFANNENVYVTPTTVITDSRFLRVHGKYGFLREPIHYDVKSDGRIVLFGQNMKSLLEDDILTFVFYLANEI